MANEDRDDWSELWDARVASLERVLGKSSDHVLHGVTPFFFGFEMGGAADIIPFYKHVDGVVYVTAELIGCEKQKQNSMGNYELMICHRNEFDWGHDIIGRLAFYTLDAVIKLGDTMDIGSATPDEATVQALLFDNYATFEVLGQPAGLMLCIGITEGELAHSRSEGSASLIQSLKAGNVYPFTDLYRASIV
jgi:hypothetical protein